MLIRSDSVLAILTDKVRRAARDASQHLLCPRCGTRTKLYSLNDGRKKCGRCGKKFHLMKKSDAARLRRFADILVCFALDLTAQQAADLTGYRYRLTSDVYGHLRSLVASRYLADGKIELLTETEPCDRTVHDSEFCRRCRSRFRCDGRKSGDAPVFGVRLDGENLLTIDPLRDADALRAFGMLEDGEATDTGATPLAAYAGFICRGTFHTLDTDERSKHKALQLWTWIRERLQRHHGIRKKNEGWYLKELEWRYNNRHLGPEELAGRLAGMAPDDVLAAWKH